MIKTLELKDFQSHESSLFEFDPGVNIITGVSDSGKSAALRGLYWVMTNRPSGLGFIRKAANKSKKGKAVVSTTIVEGTKSIEIVRSRTATENACTCGDQQFSTLGKDVPEDVVKALNMNDINVQRQLDGPFLILSSPGAVAAKFNQYTNLDKVDQMVATISAKVREATQEKAYVEGDMDGIDRKLEKYKWLAEYSVLVDAHEAVLAEANTSRNIAQGVISSLSVVNGINTKLDDNAVVLENRRKTKACVENVLRVAHTHQAAQLQLSDLLNTIGRYKLAQNQHHETQTHLDTSRIVQQKIAAVFAVVNKFEASSVNFTKLCDAIDVVSKVDSELLALRAKKNRDVELKLLDALAEVATDIQAVEIRISNIGAALRQVAQFEALEAQQQQLLASAQRKSKQVQVELAAFDSCPTCGQKLTEQAKQYMEQGT